MFRLFSIRGIYDLAGVSSGYTVENLRHSLTKTDSAHDDLIAAIAPATPARNFPLFHLWLESLWIQF